MIFTPRRLPLSQGSCRILWSLMLVMFTGIFTACDDETATLGVFSDDDALSSTTQVFTFTTRSLGLDSVSANSRKCYLGQIHDPETNTDIKAEFLAQFHTFEDYTLPSTGIVRNAAGEIEADSADIKLYYSSYAGSANNPMKIQVYELDQANVVREDSTYSTNIKLENFLPTGATPLASKVFTASDYTLDDEVRTSTSYNTNVRVVLPKDYGTKLLKAAVEHPEYFRNSWEFMHHVCPGFFFKLQSGAGTMLTLDVSTLNIYFRYKNGTKTYDGICRFAATQEVIQSTRFLNTGFENLTSVREGDYTYYEPNRNYTFLKSPAGIATEVTLPVNDIVSGHETDSITQVRFSLTRYNSSIASDNVMGTPSTLLLLPKSRLTSFFNKHELPDARSSYITNFDSGNNSYTFNNVGRLITYLYQQKQQGMKDEGLTAEQWEAAHPDWNKLVAIPVSVTTMKNSYGTETAVSVNHDFSLTSIRLVGGTTPLQLQVVYSSYK